ncbi:MAG: hypothetical protein HFE73_09185 [Firmicutes bacterium]|nr:hypothetical protein [Bacillota bacterium]
MEIWDFHKNEIRELTEEERRKALEGKEGDGFDATYNMGTFWEFYSPGERFSEVFYETSYEISSLHRYLEYSRRYFSRYLQEGKAYEQTLRTGKDVPAEEVILHDETFGPDEQYLPKYNFEAVLLMLYTIFENSIRRLTAELEEKKDVTFDRRKYRGSTVDRYLGFLCETCGLQVVFQPKDWKRFESIRKIRNFLVHRGGMVQGNSIALDYDFLIDGFETIGRLLDALETAYWDNYDKDIGGKVHEDA